MPSSTAGSAVNPNGTLKDAADIMFYHSAEDDSDKPISGPSIKKKGRALSDKGYVDAMDSEPVRQKPRCRMMAKKLLQADPAEVKKDKGLMGFFTKNFAKSSSQPHSDVEDKASSGAEESAPPMRVTHKLKTSTLDNQSLASQGRKRARSDASSDYGHDALGVSVEENEEDEEDEEDELDKYERQRKEDKEKPVNKRHKRGEDPRTKDIRTFYGRPIRETDKGKPVHRCPICKEEFSGNVTALRAHIRRHWSTHGKQYMKNCERAGVTPNKTAMPSRDDDADDEGDSLRQSSLGDHVKSVPNWSSRGLLEHITALVISEDQALSLIDKKTFRSLLKYQRPQTKESEIPHRTKLTEFVIEKATVVKDRMRVTFKV
ncbi:hypothetical protein K488DRAFT_91860 [Vararia minispora EC-137]|uniref:Uncharacterized protein n=1 Tax=Vararia minispora EC-137 TaxID=1314806 RepID=A0ACB8Q4T4_9AGAM|nr:hypothetical protein K488DRAFT_91860 [Vararia minispora EC-137]